MTDSRNRDEAAQLSTEYAAGFFDGEGCVSFSTRKPRHSSNRKGIAVLITITHTDPTVLRLVQGRWGGSIKGPFLQQGLDYLKPRLPIYRWSASHAIAARFLTDLSPFLIVKRGVVDNALAFMATVRRRGRMSDGDYASQLGFYERHKTFTRRAEPAIVG